MAVNCPSCGAENRDKARFCTRCAGPLEPVFPAADAAARRDRAKERSAKRKRKTGRGAAATSSWAEQRAWLPVALLFAGALVLVTVWLGWGPKEVAEPVRPLMTESAPPTPPVATSAGESTRPRPAADGSAAVSVSPALEREAAQAAERLRQSVEKLRQEDEARSAEKARRRIAALESRERLQREEQARKKAQALAARRGAREEASLADDAGPSTTPTPATPPVVAEVVPAPTPEPRAGVREKCAGESNFFARDLCHIDACKKVENRKDPVCVQYREMERNGRFGNL